MKRTHLVPLFLALLMGCDRTPIGATDDGIEYVFSNRCQESIVVDFAVGSYPFTLAVGENKSVGTLDQDLTSVFVVRRTDGTGEVRFTPPAARFNIEDELCPT